MSACVLISYIILRCSRSYFARPTTSVDFNGCSNHIYNFNDGDDDNAVGVSGSSSMGSWCGDLAVSRGSEVVTWG